MGKEALGKSTPIKVAGGTGSKAFSYCVGAIEKNQNYTKKYSSKKPTIVKKN